MLLFYTSQYRICKTKSKSPVQFLTWLLPLSADLVKLLYIITKKYLFKKKKRKKRIPCSLPYIGNYHLKSGKPNYNAALHGAV